MYRCGFEWGRRDIARFAARFPEEFGKSLTEARYKFMLETWWWPLQVAGWGAWRPDLSHRKEGLIFVDLFDSVFYPRRDDGSYDFGSPRVTGPSPGYPTLLDDAPDGEEDWTGIG